MMKPGIYAVVRPSTEKDVCFHYKCNDHYGIYDKLMELTDGDHETSSDVASWCELAGVGEIYKLDTCEIEIVNFE